MSISKSIWKFSTIGLLMTISASFLVAYPNAAAASQRPGWSTSTETSCHFSPGYYGSVLIELRSRTGEVLSSNDFQCSEDQSVLIGLFTPERPSKFHVEITLIQSDTGDELGDVFDGVFGGKPSTVSVLDGDTGNEITTMLSRPQIEH